MLEPNFTPFPLLTTQRLILRKLTLNDAEEVFIQRSHPVIRKYIKKAPAADLQEAIEWLERILRQEAGNETINWAIVPQGEEKLIGNICLWNIEKESYKAEVGYSIHPDYFGKGLMSEALSAVIAFGFEKMKLKRIDAYTQKDNKASRVLLERHHFVRNTDFENAYVPKEELEYNVVYTLERQRKSA